MVTVAAGVNSTLGFLTRPPRRPLARLFAWYVLVISLGGFLSVKFPIVRNVVVSSPRQQVAPALPEDLLDLPLWLPADIVIDNLTMMIVMIGALLLSLPISWGYMAINRNNRFDQSVVQTIVILPLVVAAIMMIVQHSLALAFALAGVSAAVRFRNTLKDVADATYVFLALGIGIAAGVGQLGSAAVMSFIFIFASVLLWRCNYGCPDAPPAGAKAADKNPDRNGLVSVHLNDASAQRTHVESILDLFVKTWAVDRMEPTVDGGATVRYRVRLRKGIEPHTVVHELLFHGEDLVVDATFEAT